MKPLAFLKGFQLYIFIILIELQATFLAWAFEKEVSPSQLDSKVKRVLEIIAQMEKANLSSQSRPLKEAIVTEDELNAYLAYRIKTEPLEMVQEVKLKLFEGNYIEGRVILDLNQEKLPDFVPKIAVLFFSATFKIESGKIYFDFKKIFLGAQELPVNFVSEIIKQIDLAHGNSPEGLNRSYVLPFGLKDIKSKKGLAIFYY
ncbi:MAG: hypothetical protein N3B16_01420 [Candidatus Aminicenantes bacterium]|nr:hypothetical protein [Candidatus Aminicenantes bacterium]